MPCRALPRNVAIATLAAALMPITLLAQTPQPGEVTASTSLSGVYQFDTDLDHGGKFRWAAGIASGSVTRQVTPQFTAGLALRYDFEGWKFSHPVEFGGVAPWSHLNAPNIAVDLRYAVGSDLVAGVVRQIDDTKVFPFLIVNWQINDRWRLANPFAAGPAYGTGLELVYAPDDHWEFAGGGAYRSTRYRLDDAGVAPGRIGENRYFPLFARAARNFGAQTSVDLYAGIALNGRLLVSDASGATATKDDYSTAPLLGLALAHRL